MLFCTTKPRFSELALDADSIDTKIDDFGENFSDDDGNGTPEFRSFSPQISTVDSPFNINYNKLATSPISRNSREINSKTHQNGDQFARTQLNQIHSLDMFQMFLRIFPRNTHSQIELHILRSSGTRRLDLLLSTYGVPHRAIPTFPQTFQIPKNLDQMRIKVILRADQIAPEIS